MLAVLRYRRIPYRRRMGSWRMSQPDDLPRPKVELLPTLYFTGENGKTEALVGSTPLIRRLEADHAGRAVVPGDPAIAFLDALLEDYADEWLTKAMFHYRWVYAPDIDRAGEILPRWTVTPRGEAELAELKAAFSERQISRLHVVGSNPTTGPVIEASYERFLDVLKARLADSAFLFGARPSSADFAAFGQLTQLTHFDPTPMAVTLEHAPRVWAWVELVEDLSGLEPEETDWVAPGAIPDSLRALFAEAGRCYAPVMLANARALLDGADTVETEVDGKPWVQQPFPYQGKCLQGLRRDYAALDAGARAVVDDVLAGTGCEALFVGA